MSRLTKIQLAAASPTARRTSALGDRRSGNDRNNHLQNDKRLELAQNRIMMLRIFIVCITAVLCNNACSSISRDYRRLANSQIIFPATLQRIEGHETQPLTLDTAKVRILVYYDASVCGTCALEKIPEWKELIDSARLLCPDTELLFLLTPRKDEYHSVLQKATIHQTIGNIAIDATGDFSAYNRQIPAETRMHTMLLDRTGRVTVVGDPRYNPAIRELYLTELERLANHNKYSDPK